MTDEPWSALALLGSARVGAIPAAPHPALHQAFAALDSSAPEHAWLDAAALVAVARRAGCQPRRDVTPVPPCTLDDAQRAPAAASVALRRMLAGEHSDCLREWLAAAAEQSFVAQPRDLPALLDRAARERALASAVARVLGVRGRWLARRREHWSAALGEHGAEGLSFEAGAEAERRAWLERTLESDGALAARTLSAAWSDEAAQEREGLLAVVARRPREELREFLEERAVCDRRAAVRRLARRALLRLPSGGWRQRATARAEQILRLERGPKLVVELPAAFEREWLRDGLEEKAPQGVGPRAHWARQILGAVPLEHWRRKFGLEPRELLRANRDEESRGVIARAWIDVLLDLPQPEFALAVAHELLAREPWPDHAPTRVEFALAWLDELPHNDAAAAVELLIGWRAADPLFVELLASGRLRPLELRGAELADALLEIAVDPTEQRGARLAPFLGNWTPRSVVDSLTRRLAARAELTAAAEALARRLEFRRDFLTALNVLPRP